MVCDVTAPMPYGATLQARRILVQVSSVAQPHGLLLAIIVCAAMAACAPKHATSQPPASSAGKRSQEIYPPALEGSRSLELGNLVRLLMPDEPGLVGWNWAVDSPIKWRDAGYQESGTVANRNGIVRVNVMGKISTVVRQRSVELGWTVTFSSRRPQSGVEEIAIEPGAPDGNDQCFGASYDGCSFNPMPSLANAGITATPVCNKDFNADNFEHTYRLSSPGKATTYLRWMQSAGSGGESTIVSMYPGASLTRLCAPAASGPATER